MGFFPLDEELVIWKMWSEGVVKLAVWEAGRSSYREAEETLRRMAGIEMCASSIWACTQEWTEGLCEWQAAQQAEANAVPSRDHPQPGEAKHSQRMGVSVDGWLVNIVDEGWKEVKTGAVFEVVTGEQYDPITGEHLELAQAQACTYATHLGGPEEFGEVLWTEASQRRVPAAYDKVFIGDAASWIWGVCEDYFPESEQVVDWYHAKEHLHAAAHVLHGEGTDDARRWAERRKTALYQGHAASIAGQLDTLAAQHSGDRAKKLHTEATYFRNQQRRMRYLEYREDGWPIGSGTIESGCKQFQMRFKGPGMRWSRPGAQRMLALRASVMSDYFDTHWDLVQNWPLN